MNRYEFENLISDYLEGELSFSKRKEFESYLEENEDARLLFLRVKNTLNDMKNAEKISTTDNFNSKLLSKIKDKAPLMPNDRSNIFGLSPLYASIFSSLCLAVIFISYSLIAPNPVSDSMFNSGNSVTDSTFVVSGLGGITFNIRPLSSRNFSYTFPLSSVITSSWV